MAWAGKSDNGPGLQSFALECFVGNCSRNVATLFPLEGRRRTAYLVALIIHNFELLQRGDHIINKRWADDATSVHARMLFCIMRGGAIIHRSR